MAEGKKIGEINGIWGILFRINQVVIPLIVAWAVWVTTETFANKYVRDQHVTHLELATALDELPPQHTRDKIRNIEHRIEMIDSRIATIERHQTRILTILERLEEQR